MARPPRLIRLALNPNDRIRMKVISAAIGSAAGTTSAAVTTSAARQSPRNSKQ